MVDKNRIPAADGRGFANWNLPEVMAGHVVEVGQRAQPGPADPESVPVAPALTARQLEEITSEAQREGHAIGRAEGLARGLEEGRAEGLRQGLEEGRAQARGELERQVGQLQALMERLLAPIAGQQDAIEAALTHLALDIARAALDREPALEAPRLVPVVRAALRELPVGERNITVHLHPQQLELIRAYSAWPEGWRVQADSAVEPGACRIETDHSVVDYSLGLRFRQVAARLLAQQADSEPPEPGLLLDAGDD